MTNPNLCSSCSPEMVDDLLTDAGTCGACGEVKNVHDPDLIALYAGFNISEMDISCYLPRLRSSHADAFSPKLDWTQIGEKINQRLMQQMAEMEADLSA